MAANKKPWRKLIASGVATVALYGLLFGHETEVLATFTRTDGWYPALPVVTTFLFSLVHGAFTGYFWDALGVKPRARIKEAKQA